jgi:hypothetical protein
MSVTAAVRCHVFLNFKNGEKMKINKIIFLFLFLLLISQCKDHKYPNNISFTSRHNIKINLNVSIDEKYKIAKKVVEDLFISIKNDVKKKFSNIDSKELDNIILQYPIKIYNDERAEKSAFIVVSFTTKYEIVNPKDVTDFCTEIIQNELEKYYKK